MYYRGAQAAIVVYDITSETSFSTLKRWVDELRDLGPGGIQIIVVGNKCDMESDRQVTQAAARKYAKSIRAMFLEASAKMDVNVSTAFTDLAKRLIATGKVKAGGGDGGGGGGGSLNPLRAREQGGGCC